MAKSNMDKTKDLNEAPDAFAKVGQGWVGYVGDVNVGIWDLILEHSVCWLFVMKEKDSARPGVEPGTP